jgi:hypothetical protein
MRFLNFVFVALLLSCSTNSKKQELPKKPAVQYQYEPNVSTLTGVLKREMFWGPPNYGGDTLIDTKEYYAILHLDEPIELIGDTTNHFNSARSDVKKIQVLGGGSFGPLMGKRVTIKGKLMGAQFGHHHTDVLVIPSAVGSEVGENSAKDPR